MKTVNLQTLWHKEMDRKEFLQHVGVFIMAAAGISAVLKHLSAAPNKLSDTAAKHKSGYGARSYGR